MNIEENPETVEEWEAVLMPWVAALTRAALHCEIHWWSTVSDMENLLLAFRTDAPFGCTDEAWLQRMEAMELLDLLARVDKRLAWDLLTRRTLYSCEEWLRVGHSEIPVLPRFKLRIDDGETLSNDENPTFQRLLEMNKPTMFHSAAYTTVKEKLLAKWSATHGGKAFDRTKEGHVEVVVSLPVPKRSQGDSTVADKVFARIEQLMAAHRSSGETVEVSDDREANPLSLSFIAFHPVSTTDLASISRMTSMGMPLTCLELHALDRTEFDTELWSGFLKDHLTSPPGSGTQQLVVDTAEISTSGMETLYLAIAHSQSLREVDFAFGSCDNDLMRWLWLVYALFSKDSDHNIHTVSLDIRSLDAMSYVKAMQAVLRHADPLACLYEILRADDFEEMDEVDVPSTASTVVLKPSAIVNRGSSSNNDQTHEPMAIDPSLAYRIFCTDRSEVLEMRPLVTRERHSVRHLTLDADRDRNLQTVIAFVELIGEPVERLTLDNLQLEGDACNEFFDAMLASLPNLKRLDLVDCTIESLDFLLRNTSRLESLRLCDVFMRDGDYDRRSRSCVRLVEALSDCTHPLAFSLLELQVDWAIATPESIVAMLHKNKRLRRCEVADYFNSFPLLSSFLAHDGEVLPGRLGPMAPAETLAFLSVVTGVISDAPAAKKTKATPTNAYSAQYKLNTDLLRLILELAAPTPRRTCKIVASGFGLDHPC